MSSKTSCAICINKNTSGIFKCQGCSQTFCLKHTTEHRHSLDNELNEILLEHDNLRDTLNKNKPQSFLLFDQINQWEKDSIEKIKQTAQDARIQVQQLADLEKESTLENFSQITKQLENACENHEYLENDLSQWRILLEQFRYDLTNLSPSIILRQDRTNALIKDILISKVHPQLILNETLVSNSKEIQFDDQQHIAMHCGPDRTPAYVTGTREYSSGQHQLRFFLSKKTSEFVLSFNIKSTSCSTEFLTYGWQSDDCINPSQCCLSNNNCLDLKGKTKFHIDLLIDCTNSKISYFNEKTRCEKEIQVDEKKCPRPWKLYFYLYDVGDCVRLLSSSQISID